MGERLLCKQEVIGSIPFTSTRADAGDRMAQITSTADRDPAVIAAIRLLRAMRGEDQVWFRFRGGRAGMSRAGGRGSGAGVD